MSTQFQREIGALREQLLAVKIDEERDLRQLQSQRAASSDPDRLFERVPHPGAGPEDQGGSAAAAERLRCDLQAQMEQLKERLRADFSRELQGWKGGGD